MFSRRLMAGLVAAATVVTSVGASITSAGAQGIDLNTVRRGQGRPAQPAVRPQPPAPVVLAPRVRPPQQVAQPQVARRLGGGGGGGGGSNTGRNIALGVGAAVIGGILLSESARAERRSRPIVVEESYEDADDRRQRCDDNFRRFDWDDGTYRNRYGERVRCPYLRDRD